MNPLILSPLTPLSQGSWGENSSKALDTQVYELEQEADKQAEQVPAAERAAYRTMIRRKITQIRVLIAEMRAQGSSENAINSAIDGLIVKFTESKNRFLEGNQQFAMNQAAACARNAATANKIKQCTPNFAPIARLHFDEAEDEEPKKPEMSELEKRKIAIARCVQDPDASLSLALPALTEGLNPQEKKELIEVIPKAPVGAAANAVAIPLAAVHKTLTGLFEGATFVVKNILKGYMLEGAAMHGKYKQVSDALEGKNPQVNEELQKAIPNWMVATGEAMHSFDAKLDSIDAYMAATYYSHPGLVKAGLEGGIDLAAGYALSKTYQLGKYAFKSTFAAKAAKSSVYESGLNCKLCQTPGAFDGWVPTLPLNPLQTTLAKVSVLRVPANKPRFLRGRASVFETDTHLFQSHLSKFWNDEGGWFKLPFKPTKENHPEVQNFLGGVYSSIKTSSKNTPFNNLLDARRGVDLKHFPNTSLENALLSKNLTEVKYLPIPNQNKRNLITRISTEKGDFTLKEFKDGHDLIGEALGYDLLKPLELRHLNIPTVVAVGQERGFFFMLKSYLEGPTLGDMMLTMGSKRAGFKERADAFRECLTATKKTGKALGELQKKTSQTSRALPKEFIDKDCRFWTKLLQDYIKMANDDLKRLGLPQIEISAIDFMALERGLLEKPPLYSYGFGDIHPGQFVYSKAKGTIGYIDAEYFPASVGLSKEPLSVGVKDYYLFHSNLEITGTLSGLKSYEIKQLQQAFKEGFHSEFSLKGLNGFLPAQDFFELYSAVDTISALTEDEVVKRFLITKNNGGAFYLQQQLQSKVRTLNELLGASKPRLTKTSLLAGDIGIKNIPFETKIGKIGLLQKKMLTFSMQNINYKPGTLNLFAIITHLQKVALENNATSIRISFPYHERALSILEKKYYTEVKQKDSPIPYNFEKVNHKIFVEIPVEGASREAFFPKNQMARLDKYQPTLPVNLGLAPENLKRFEVFSMVKDGIYHVKIDHILPKKGSHVNFHHLKKRIGELATEHQAETVRLHFGFDFEPEMNQRLHHLLIRMFGPPKMHTATLSFDFKPTG